MLLNISSSNIVTHSNGYMKGDKYCLTYILLKLNYLQSRVETQYRKIIFIKPSNIKHFIERSSVRSKKWVPSGFSVLDGFYSFFHKMATLM